MSKKAKGETLDLSKFVKGYIGEHYAHEYDEKLAMFKMLAYADSPRRLVNVPSCWAPFVTYLGHVVESVKPVKEHGWEFEDMDWMGAYEDATYSNDPRRVVEVASTCRPELVHALYCADTEWPCLLRKHVAKKKFPVTCNGSFFRPEIAEYRELLHDYQPTKRLAVITSCSAEKPYPAGIHRAIKKVLPSDRWQIIVATGVLGLIPDDLWDRAPEYDSGLPNFERVIDTVAWYFTKHKYHGLVAYSDFYSYAVERGLNQSAVILPVDYLHGNTFRDTYENLVLPEHLHRLEVACIEMERRHGPHSDEQEECR